MVGIPPITPGPWAVSSREDRPEAMPPEWTFWVTGTDARGYHRVIASMTWTEAENESADARAIAQVPAMLEALVEVYAMSTTPPPKVVAVLLAAGCELGEFVSTPPVERAFVPDEVSTWSEAEARATAATREPPPFGPGRQA